MQPNYKIVVTRNTTWLESAKALFGHVLWNGPSNFIQTIWPPLFGIAGMLVVLFAATAVFFVSAVVLLFCGLTGNLAVVRDVKEAPHDSK